MRPVLDLLAPLRCLGCGVPHHVPWCPACVELVGQHRLLDACGRCGSPDTGDGHGCWPDELPVRVTFVPYRYRGLVADTIVRAKLRGLAAGWKPLGRMLGSHVGDHRDRVDAVTAVPTEPGRRRRRGFDHSRLLAEGVAAATGLPHVVTLRAGRGAPDRGTARVHAGPAVLPPGVFRPERNLGGARLLLVDDVLTTGATAGAAIRALVAAGAANVDLAVVARAGANHLGRQAYRSS